MDTRGQPLVLIRHRASDDSFNKVETVLSSRLDARLPHCAGARPDNSQHSGRHPRWIPQHGQGLARQHPIPVGTARYVGGVENVKINLMLRIYSAKWHVYAGLAILNPEAHKQINHFARSTTELFYLMLEGRHQELRERVYAAKEKVFGAEDSPKWGAKPLLKEGMLDRFSLGKQPENAPSSPNNHLSLLAMVDSWSALGIVPYDHMICSTPLFRLWLGVTEHIYRTPGLLDECLRVGIEDKTFRRDDLQFTIAACGWAECVSLRSFETWKERFAVTQKFFEPRFPGAIDLGNAMIKAVLESTDD